MTTGQGVARRNDRVRVALIGLDHWYTALPLSDALNTRADTRLVVVWDRDRKRAREVASKAGADVSDDWRSAVARTDVDAVASFVTTRDNPDVVIAAARARKHVLCVKPVAMGLSEVELIAQAVTDAGITFFPIEGYYRLASHCRALRSLVRSAAVGRVLTVSVTGRAGLPRAWPSDSSAGWYGDPNEVPGGAWIDHGIYQVALVRWILGSEPVNVRGVVARLNNYPIAHEDYGLAVFTFSDGAVVSLEETWTLPRGMYYSQMDIVGSEGMLSYSNRDGKIWIGQMDGRGASRWAEHNYGQDREDGDYLSHFVECILRGTLPVCSVEDARADLAACLAFYEAARIGGVVTVP